MSGILMTPTTSAFIHCKIALRAMAAVVLAAGLAGCATAPPLQTASDQQAIVQVQTYLDGLQHFKAHFTQTGTDGAADGFVWLDRPGRLRVAYVRPAPKLILANHGRLLLVDQLTGATSNMPVSRTPLDILLSPQVQLVGANLAVTAVAAQPGALQIGVVKAAAPTQGRLTLQFALDPVRLVGVVVQDSTGRSNTLALTDLERSAGFSPDLFQYVPVSSPPS
jgi:outer membrane lipoprotein-sorting protein